MSWDVIVQNYQGNPPSDDDLSREPEPLGTAAAIRKRIDKHLPGVVWTDPKYGVFEESDFSIEFDIGGEKPITHITLSVRGGGKAFAALKSFAQPNKWSLFDCSESTFLDLESSTPEGFLEFQRYRDRVLPKGIRRSKAAAKGNLPIPSKPKKKEKPKAKRNPKKA